MVEKNNLEFSMSAGKRVFKIIRTILIIFIFGFVISLFMYNTTKPQETAKKVWDSRTTIGDLSSPNHYIMYTDLMCPYCNLFSKVLKQHEAEFKQYLAEHKILWEIRPTDFLREYSQHASIYSEWGAEALTCAKRQGRFWDYYYAAIDALDATYYQKGVGNSSTAPKISDMTTDFWTNIAKNTNLSPDFYNCFEKHEALEEMRKTTARVATELTPHGGGIPFFKFNSTVFSGIDPNDDWYKIKLRLDQGLK